jgi:hypothetical protein
MLGLAERPDDAHDGPQPENHRATLFVNTPEASAYLLKTGADLINRWLFLVFSLL